MVKPPLKDRLTKTTSITIEAAVELRYSTIIRRDPAVTATLVFWNALTNPGAMTPGRFMAILVAGIGLKVLVGAAPADRYTITFTWNPDGIADNAS
jgi:hypothetical protein